MSRLRSPWTPRRRRFAGSPLPPAPRTSGPPAARAPETAAKARRWTRRRPGSADPGDEFLWVGRANWVCLDPKHGGMSCWFPGKAQQKGQFFFRRESALPVVFLVKPRKVIFAGVLIPA